MEKIKVSVVMAVYNAEKYLNQAMDTIVNQTLRDIEIICVNDMSTDDSLAILKEYAEADSRIRIFQHTEKTDDAAAARNMGISKARGEYLSVLDADDFFELDMLEKAYNKAIRTRADIVAYEAWFYKNANGSDEWAPWVLRKDLLPEQEVFSGVDCPNVIFNIVMGAAWNCMFRREFIEKEGILFYSMHGQDDEFFVLVSFATARRITTVLEPFVHYRCDVSGGQHSKDCHWPMNGYLLPERMKAELENRGIYEEYWMAFANKAIMLSKWTLEQMHPFSNFAELSEQLSSRYLREWRADRIPTSNLIEADFNDWRKEAIDSSPSELIDRYYLKKLLGEEAEQLLRGMPWGSKVIVYGAGDRGRKVFKWLFSFKWITLVGWADQNYDSIGFPVMSPDALKEMKFDYVVAAVEKEETFLAVKDHLVKMRIPVKKILWLGHIS